MLHVTLRVRLHLSVCTTIHTCGYGGALWHVFDKQNAFMVPEQNSYHFPH